MNMTLHLRLTEDLLIKIENETIRRKKNMPGTKISKSDVVRNILESYFKEKEARGNVRSV